MSVADAREAATPLSRIRRGHRLATVNLRSGATPGAILGVALIGTMLLNIGMGAVPVAPDEIVRILARHLGELASSAPGAGVAGDIAGWAAGLPGASMLVQWLERALAPAAAWFDADVTRQQDAVVWAIRLPRTLLGAIIGCGLAISGAVMQGVFRNPLADPGLIGVASGAALGAVAAIVLDISVLGIWTLPAAAFSTGLAVTLVVYLIARHEGRTEVVTLLLGGIALNALAASGVGLLISIADDQELRSATFWTLGSLGGTSWHHVGIVGIVTLGGILVVMRCRTSLNLFALGEREARHLGVEVERVRIVLLLVTTAMTGAAVAFAGAIGFVGLVVPHLVRLWTGPDHQRLIPYAALAGATLLPLADLASRSLAAPSEFPIGVTMSLIGGPFFIWLLVRTRNQQGGWG